MSKHGQLYNEWLTNNTMDRYMSDHKDRMENDKGVEEQELRNKVVTLFATFNLGEGVMEREQRLMNEVLDIVTTLHHQLQKARHNWLREEIVRLEGMKIMNQKKKYDGNDIMSACDAYNCAFLEWGEVIRYEHGHDHAIQTIIDRYQRELDQDKTLNPYDVRVEPVDQDSSNTN